MTKKFLQRVNLSAGTCCYRMILLFRVDEWVVFDFVSYLAADGYSTASATISRTYAVRSKPALCCCNFSYGIFDVDIAAVAILSSADPCCPFSAGCGDRSAHNVDIAAVAL